MADPIALRWNDIQPGLKALGQCLAVGATLALLTCAAFILQTNPLTIGLLYLVFVICVASLFGFWQASVTSILAVLLLDYYFEPPHFDFRVESPSMFVALVTFEGTALAIGRLHGRELRIAREAAAYKAEMEKLYELSRSFLLLDLHVPLGPQLLVLIQRIFDVSAVALFDAHLGRQDRVGDWQSGEENLARECFIRDVARDDRRTQTSERLLRGGNTRSGALVVRGKLSPVVVDALAALAAISFDRHKSFESEDRAEATKRSEQLRAAVLDALAHKLKTPLTAVQTASSGLLELGHLSDSQTELVTLINAQATHLNELCTRLLRTARLDPNQVDPNADQVKVKEVISEVLSAGSVENGRDRFRIMVDDPDLTMMADRKLLGLILTQYIDNAQKYSNPGTPIEIAAHSSHDEVLVSVHNFGPPIRIEERERIFDRFYRSPDRKDEVPGTGIGLSVARKAAEAHHGHVWVISDEKEGTTFFLSLPGGARRAR